MYEEALMENGSCGASPECSCTVDWALNCYVCHLLEQLSPLKLNSFTYVNVHIYVPLPWPELRRLHGDKTNRYRVLFDACIGCCYWLISSRRRSVSALLLCPHRFSQWVRHVLDKKNKKQNIWWINGNLVHDWCHWRELQWRADPLEGGRPAFVD